MMTRTRQSQMGQMFKWDCHVLQCWHKETSTDQCLDTTVPLIATTKDFSMFGATNWRYKVQVRTYILELYFRGFHINCTLLYVIIQHYCSNWTGKCYQISMYFGRVADDSEWNKTIGLPSIVSCVVTWHSWLWHKQLAFQVLFHMLWHDIACCDIITNPTEG